MQAPYAKSSSKTSEPKASELQGQGVYITDAGLRLDARHAEIRHRLYPVCCCGLTRMAESAPVRSASPAMNVIFRRLLACVMMTAPKMSGDMSGYASSFCDAIFSVSTHLPGQ